MFLLKMCSAGAIGYGACTIVLRIRRGLGTLPSTFVKLTAMFADLTAMFAEYVLVDLQVRGPHYRIRGGLIPRSLRVREPCSVFAGLALCSRSTNFPWTVSTFKRCIYSFFILFLTIQALFQRDISSFFKTNRFGNYFLTYFIDFR